MPEAGIYDQWILAAMYQTSSFFISAVRILRLLRLIRLVKVVRAFLKSDLEWVEEDGFQGTELERERERELKRLFFFLLVLGLNKEDNKSTNHGGA